MMFEKIIQGVPITIVDARLPNAWKEGVLMFWPRTVYAGRATVYGERVDLTMLPPVVGHWGTNGWS